MTCIVALIHNNSVYMAGDSAAVLDMDYEIRGDKKVFKVDEFIIGFSDSFRLGNILKYKFTPPKITKDIEIYMNIDFIESIKELCRDNGILKMIDNEESNVGQILVGIHGRIFNIDYDFNIGWNLDKNYSIGCGSSYAISALQTLDIIDPQYKKYSPEKRLNIALEIAEKNSLGVKPPYYSVSNI